MAGTSRVRVGPNGTEHGKREGDHLQQQRVELQYVRCVNSSLLPRSARPAPPRLRRTVALRVC